MLLQNYQTPIPLCHFILLLFLQFDELFLFSEESEYGDQVRYNPAATDLDGVHLFMQVGDLESVEEHRYPEQVLEKTQDDEPLFPADYDELPDHLVRGEVDCYLDVLVLLQVLLYVVQFLVVSQPEKTILHNFDNILP